MKYILLLFICIQSQLYAQVGIGTVSPESDLHVKENTQFSNQINVGGTGNTPGNPGLKGELLTSKGSNNSLEWQKIKDITIVPLIILSANNDANELDVLTNVNTIIPFSQVITNESNFINYDSDNNEFIVKTPGVYRIIANVSSNNFINCTNPRAKTTLIKTTLINDIETESIISGKTSSHLSCTRSIPHLIYGIDVFKLNDKIGLYTEANRTALTSANITIIYTGDIDSIESNE